MLHIDIDNLSAEELKALKLAIAEKEEKDEEKKAKEAEKAMQLKLEKEKRIKLERDSFTKDSSKIIGELIERYEQLSKLNINELSEEDKLKIYIQKAYIENMLIDSWSEDRCSNVGLKNYNGDLDKIHEKGMDYVYNEIYFEMRHRSNEQLINICMKKLAKLLGEDEKNIVQIANHSAMELEISAYFKKQELLEKLDKIDEYFIFDCDVYIYEDGSPHRYHLDKQYATNVRDLRYIYEDNNIPLKNLSNQDRKRISQYLCSKFFNKTLEEKFSTLVSMLLPSFLSRLSTRSEEEVKKILEAALSSNGIKKEAEKPVNLTVFRYNLIEKFFFVRRLYGDYYLYYEDYAFLTENDIPNFATREEKEQYINDFNLSGKGSI